MMADYISREAFIADKRKWYCKNCDRRKGMKNGKLRFCYEIGGAACKACGINDMLDEVEDYPAADVVPVVRGKWTEYHTKCNLGYGKIYYQHEECSCQIFEAPYNYCPNCGAKMEESDG